VRLLLATALALLLAAPAEAASVRVVSSCQRTCAHSAVFTAAPGEANELAVTGELRASTFHDARAEITPGRLCTAIDADTVRCVPPDTPEADQITAEARLGDGDDLARATAAIVDGGPGRDRLEGDGYSLTGGPGADLLRALGPRRLNSLGRRLLAARRHIDVSVVYREYGSREGFSTRLSLLRRACGPPGRTLAATREARVYARGARLLGCHRDGRRTVRLGARRALLGVRAAGRFAAVALRGRRLQVFDLRRGRAGETSPERIWKLTALRLTDGGVAAYIARRRDGVPEIGSPGFSFAVRDPDLDARYLRIAGRLIAWRSDRAFAVAEFSIGPAAGRGPVGSNGLVVLEARRDELFARPVGGYGRAVRLGHAGCECISSSGFSGIADVRLAGPFAAARQASSDFRAGIDRGSVLLADTRDGTHRETCTGEVVGSYVVTSAGGVACAVSEGGKQIRSGGAVVDEGRGIDLASLRRRGETIVWRHDGAERSAPLPRPG
jgi:hypothetical protein